MVSEALDVKALVFDVFGTVVDWRSSVAREAEAFLSLRGHKLDWNAFADRWREGYQPAMAPVRQGKRPWVSFEVLHKEILIEMLSELGVEAITADDLNELNQAWRRLDPWPDVPHGLTRLRQVGPVVALSNGGIAQMIALARWGAYNWDAILGAQVSQTYKPDPKSYLDSAKILDLRPDQVMMVAAHPWDLTAAAGCGLRTAYVHRATEYGAEMDRKRPAKGTFDIEVDSFEDLADRLGA
ncbi:MAG: haloacid dehalogenase type II [Alphaproteobacteria bacterium]